MVDEHRTENHRLQFVLDEEPFDLGVKVVGVGVGDTAGSVFEQLHRSPIKDAQLILIDANGSRPRHSDVTNETTAPPTDDYAPVEIAQVSALIEGANLICIVTCLEGATTEAAQTVAALSKSSGCLKSRD